MLRLGFFSPLCNILFFCTTNWCGGLCCKAIIWNCWMILTLVEIISVKICVKFVFWIQFISLFFSAIVIFKAIASLSKLSNFLEKKLQGHFSTLGNLCSSCQYFYTLRFSIQRLQLFTFLLWLSSSSFSSTSWQNTLFSSMFVFSFDSSEFLFSNLMQLW